MMRPWTLLLASLGALPALAAPPPDLGGEAGGASDDVRVEVPAATFTMGSDGAPDLPPLPPAAAALKPTDLMTARALKGWQPADQRPAHPVQLPRFAMDVHEVTNAQYARFLAWTQGAGGHSRCAPGEPGGKEHTPRYWGDFNPRLKDPVYARTAPFSRETFTRPDAPVVGVDWFDAASYCAWAGGRLPTEAEWELAARGTDGRRWPWGDAWDWGLANTGGEKHGRDVKDPGVEKDGFIYPAPVGSFPAGRSPAGVLDMAGNAAEWVADWYAPDAYAHAAPVNPSGPATGTKRVVRGGSSRSVPSGVTTTAREAWEPAFRTFTLGFRCAKEL